MAYHYPPPAEWQTYQTLVAGFARILYDEHTVEEYGRTGQRQHGVDVFARDHAGKNIGLQCKWTHESLNEDALRSECHKAQEFVPALDYFILWTTARRDVHLQDLAHELDQWGVYPFALGIRFWDDAIEQLNRMYTVASTYYAEWLDEHQLTADHDHRRKLRIAFDRPAFHDPIYLERDFDDLLQAVRDTLVFLKAGLLYDRYNRTLIAQALPFSLLSDAKYIEGLAKLVSMLTGLEALLRRSAAAFGTPIMTDPRDVEECDRERQRIVSKVSSLLR
ncbi:hypothetical protein [Ruania halotolerans]|uniref:hypothetical protein n=1 Tax=Ruania halotolerans TaxID=2897773 RepID=UPI001E533FBB|nr:hypothetical protein [Ruania halotolerans]UFU06598.1 hypothetical protein LQF10_00345 [Ruania halotolerans]